MWLWARMGRVMVEINEGGGEDRMSPLNSEYANDINVT